MLIIKSLIFINAIVTFTTAEPTFIRCCHGSAMVNDKIYVGGGVIGSVGEDIWSDDFFSLDLTKPFSTSSPNDMPYEEQAKLPVKSSAHALVYAKNARSGMIYLIGGHRELPEGEAIYGYSLDEKGWSSITPNIDDYATVPVNSTKKFVGVTNDDLNTIYIFNNGTLFIYDLIKDLWRNGKLQTFTNVRYAAVMLNTGEIACIGGSNSSSGTANIPMNQILIYNSITSEWYIKNASVVDGDVPSPRVGHTASIAPDGRVFIYGGFDGDEAAIHSPRITPTFAVLKYVNDNFEWYTPLLFNQSYTMRIYHTSHVYKNYLIVAFGRNLTHSRLNTIELIDIRDAGRYAVVTDFIPENSVKSSKETAIIASVFGTIGLLGIIGGIFFLIKYLRRRSNTIPRNSAYIDIDKDSFIESISFDDKH